MTPPELLRRSALELAAAIRSGEVSAAGVVEVHIERSVEFGWTKAIAFDRFAQARVEALEADRRVREAGPDEELPPLLGVPCTIKESIAVAGMPNSAGVVARADHRAETTAPAAERLLATGAIQLGATNTSELTMWVESENRLYGRTRNPYDPRRTAGGSSGGEGAAVGSGGSPIGLGTDIGGSIRLPAFFNGVFGHKPTPGLVPNAGHFPPGPTGEAMKMLGLGPLARRAEDLMPVLRAIAGPDPDDPSTREIELGDPAEVALAGMRVLVSEQASIVPAKRELRRARETAAEALEAAGAKVEAAPFKSMRRVLELYLTALREGAGTTARGLFENEGLEAPGMRTLLKRGGPHTVATRLMLASESLVRWVPERRTRKLLAAGEALTREITDAVGDGVLLHPPFRRAAPRHGATVGRPWVTNAASVFNLAGTPVTEVPLGLNRRGLPLGAQVVAAPGNDHVSIAVAMELERRLGGWVPPHTR
jgi:fatty acid amide hydrolase 2